MTIYRFPGSNETDKADIGGKAWSLQRMQGLGIPVPPAFVIGTDECARFEALGRLSDELVSSLPGAMAWLEAVSGKTFGSGDRPLLVSVRSGAAISMPGMMDTVLNLGLNDDVELRLAALTGDAAFASDVRSRFLHQYGEIVGQPVPSDPWAQLHGAVAAVFASWNSKRAVAYRADRGIPETGGTAVTIQAMVFGNLDDRSGTGVMFSRNPNDGSSTPYGEWLRRGQGEDVVSGRQTPADLETLKSQMPQIHSDLLEMAATLERDGQDVQDIEFTVEQGKLWLLQTRAAKRSPAAAVRLAVALHDEGLISAAQALSRVNALQIRRAMQNRIDPVALFHAVRLAEGKMACAGVVAGVLVTDVDEAERRALEGERIILARPTTNPDDVHAMSLVAGILTEMGGATSHAAVVSREIGVPCIVGTGLNTLTCHDGTTVTIDALDGAVYRGRLPIVEGDAGLATHLERLAHWANEDVSAPADLRAELGRYVQIVERRDIAPGGAR